MRTLMKPSDKTAHTGTDALPEDMTMMLTSFSQTHVLSEPRRSALRGRISARIASITQQEQHTPTPLDQSGAAAQFISVMRGDGWRRLHDKAQIKLLFDDGEMFAWLLKLDAGGMLPAHSHKDGAEECMVLEGSIVLNGQTYRAGDYQCALQGTRHEPVVSEQGCLVYLRSPSSKKAELMAACA
jgi:anti-sigma factor ChrR (cupin superfamily)